MLSKFSTRGGSRKYFPLTSSGILHKRGKGCAASLACQLSHGILCLVSQLCTCIGHGKFPCAHLCRLMPELRFTRSHLAGIPSPTSPSCSSRRHANANHAASPTSLRLKLRYHATNLAHRHSWHLGLPSCKISYLTLKFIFQSVFEDQNLVSPSDQSKNLSAIQISDFSKVC